MKVWLALGIAGAALAGTVANAQQARDPVPRDVASWATKIQMGYPAAALRNSEEGTVSMEIEIDETGRVRECSVTGSSGSVALDEAACAGMVDHARYDPALNEAGEPVAVSKPQSIRYVLPDATSAPIFDKSMKSPSSLGEQAWRNRVFGVEFTAAIDASPVKRALFALTIDSTGKPDGCGMLFSSGDSSLDIRTCKALVENAEFEPAQTANGEKIPGVFTVPYPDFETLGAYPL